MYYALLCLMLYPFNITCPSALPKYLLKSPLGLVYERTADLSGIREVRVTTLAFSSSKMQDARNVGRLSFTTHGPFRTPQWSLKITIPSAIVQLYVQIPPGSFWRL